MIDPWKLQPEFPDRMYGGSVARTQDDMDAIYERVQQDFGHLPNVKIHRATSESALAKFEDEHFDWVYIDGNHYYDYVLNDLELALRKVRRGGFITGDDYDWGRSLGLPVRTAVRDFMARHRLPEKKLRVLGDQFIISKQSPT